MSKTVDITSLTEFVDHICKLKPSESVSYLNKELLFRGQNNTEYDLIPSIGRGLNDFGCISIFRDERNIISMAQNKLPLNIKE